MTINKPQLQLNLTKTDMANIIAEALLDETANASIKRILNPFLANSFPQFLEHTNITLGDTAEDGSTIVTLRIPRQTTAAADTPIQSIEPLVVNETEEETEAGETDPAYVEPEA